MHEKAQNADFKFLFQDLHCSIFENLKCQKNIIRSFKFFRDFSLLVEPSSLHRREMNRSEPIWLIESKCVSAEPFPAHRLHPK